MSENIVSFKQQRSMTAIYSHLHFLVLLVWFSGESTSYVAQAGLKLVICLASGVLE